MTGLTLRPVRRADYEQIESLKAAYGLPAYTQAEWCHLYQANPALRDRDSEWAWGWVLEDGEGSVHGHLGNVPVEYSFGGRRLIAAAASDWVVAEDRRGDSLKLVLQFFRQDGPDLLLNTSASADYGRAYGTLGAVQASLRGYDRRLMWPVDAGRVAAAAGRGGALMAWPLVAFSATARLPGWRLTRRVERVSNIDGRFDGFWDELARREGLTCVRNADAIVWRYGRGVAKSDVWVHVLSDGGALSAYMIVAKTPGGNIPHVRLLDYQDLRPGRRRQAALISSVIERCRDEQVPAFQATALPDDRQREFIRLGGLPRATAPLTYYFKATEPDLQKRLERPGAWTPGIYDGDGMCGTPQFFGLES